MEETSPSLGWGRSQTCTHWGCRDFCQSVEPCTEGIRRATQPRRSRGQCQGREALLRAQRPPQLLSPSCCTCWSSTWIMQSFINSDSCVHKQFLQKRQKAFLITYLVLEQVHITASYVPHNTQNWSVLPQCFHVSNTEHHHTSTSQLFTQTPPSWKEWGDPNTSISIAN